MSIVGELAFWAALLFSAWGVAAGAIAVRGRAGRRAAFSESASRAVIATALLAALALAGVFGLLLAPDFSFAFAAEATSANLPSAYRLAALLSRGAGAWLLFAFLVAAFGAIAKRTARAEPGFAAGVSAFVFLPLAWLALAAYPYAGAAMAVTDGRGLDPAWQLPWTVLSRFTLVLFAAALAIATAHAFARRVSRRWALAAWALGAAMLVCALRRALAGPAWDLLDWIALVAWLAVALAVHRRGVKAGAAAHIAHAGAAAAVVALVGLAMHTEQPQSLHAGAFAELRDPFGTKWRFTSDGLSSYQELNRHVTAVLVDVRRDGGRTRVARTEWRYYVDAGGTPLSDGSPADAVLAGALSDLAIGLASPPAGEDAVLRVRWTPLFGFWWLAAGLMIVAAGVAGARERAE